MTRTGYGGVPVASQDLEQLMGEHHALMRHS